MGTKLNEAVVSFGHFSSNLIQNKLARQAVPTHIEKLRMTNPHTYLAEVESQTDRLM